MKNKLDSLFFTRLIVRRTFSSLERSQLVFDGRREIVFTNFSSPSSRKRSGTENIMKIVSTVDEVRNEVKKWRSEGLSVGLVPTMGYLHEGHKSLIDRAVAENDRVVVSVFVNPIQFGPTEDLATYPRDLERDAALCEQAGAALIFHPEKEDMYFDDFCTYIDMENLTKGLCGKTRPTHFRGVCTVVGKLFNIVHPDKA